MVETDNKKVRMGERTRGWMEIDGREEIDIHRAPESQWNEPYHSFIHQPLLSLS